MSGKAVIKKKNGDTKECPTYVLSECSLREAKAFTFGEVCWVPKPVFTEIVLHAGTNRVERIRTDTIPTLSGIDADRYKYGGVDDMAAGPVWTSGPKKGRTKTQAEKTAQQDARLKQIMDGTYRLGKGGGSKGVHISEYLQEYAKVCMVRASKTPKWMKDHIQNVRSSKVSEAAAMRSMAHVVAPIRLGVAKPTKAQVDAVLKAMAAVTQKNIDALNASPDLTAEEEEAIK